MEDDTSFSSLTLASPVAISSTDLIKSSKITRLNRLLTIPPLTPAAIMVNLSVPLDLIPA